MDKNNKNHKYTWRDLEAERWRGSVTQALADITTVMEETRNRIDCLDKKLSNLRVKVAGIGASAALVVSALIALLKGWLK